MYIFAESNKWVADSKLRTGVSHLTDKVFILSDNIYGIYNKNHSTYLHMLNIL